MSTPVILVIDDSATIRKMVDSHLSQEGYRVVLAPNGERGFELACELKPDLILLDHQLPGTTGIEVCRKIIAAPGCQSIPFLVSSTLRKQAYIEYMDVPNVVDSLPKPFKPELLKMAVVNALETASMIVSSQTHGTAVPEVVGETDHPAFTGDFRWLGLREVIDFLNNGRKEGILEVETERNRVCFYLQQGRIQGVVSASFNPKDIAGQLPDTLKDLAPLLPFTLSSGTSTQVTGLVELMDKKVLDPRMLRTLLRHQAAVLTRYCFTQDPIAFCFYPERTPPSLLTKASIDSCLAAVLVEGALPSSGDNSQTDDSTGWVRNSLRGQNLDRAGLSAKHVQLLSQLDATPRSAADLAARAGLTPQEAAGVLQGFLMAEWVEQRVCRPTKTLVALEPEPGAAAEIRSVLEDPASGWTGNVVKDEFSFQLLLKRKSPDVVLIALQGDGELHLPVQLSHEALRQSSSQVFLLTPGGTKAPLAATLQGLTVIPGPLSADVLKQALQQAESAPGRATAKPASRSHDAAVLAAAGAN